MDFETEKVKHIQAVFTSKHHRLKVPDSQFSIPVSANRRDLSSLIAHFLEGSGSDNDDGEAERETEFIIRGDLLRSSLESHLANKTVSSVSETSYICYLYLLFTLEPKSFCIHCESIYAMWRLISCISLIA
ncbi:Ribosome biogenesis protein WDR12 homolog, partial [Geodia barretti]